MKLVKIIWLDSIGITQNWETEEEILNVPSVNKCTSVGYILRDDEATTTIVPHCYFNPDDSMYCGAMSIPNASIVETVILHEQEVVIDDGISIAHTRCVGCRNEKYGAGCYQHELRDGWDCWTAKVEDKE